MSVLMTEENPPREYREENVSKLNPQWLEPLRILAKRVILQYNAKFVDVDELVNVAWLDLVRKFPTDYGPGIIISRATYICSRMRYYVLGYTRSVRNCGCTEINAGTMFNDPRSDSHSDTLGTSLCDALTDPHDHVEGLEIVDLISVLCSSLEPEVQRMLIMLIEGHTISGIAIHIGRPRTYVQRRVQLIRTKFKRLMLEGE